MIEMFDKENSSSLGSITEEQLDFLIGNLEEEKYRDQDYYIDAATIDLLVEKGMAPDLEGFLRTALGERTAVEIFWEDA